MRQNENETQQQAMQWQGFHRAAMLCCFPYRVLVEQRGGGVDVHGLALDHGPVTLLALRAGPHQVNVINHTQGVCDGCVCVVCLACAA